MKKTILIVLMVCSAVIAADTKPVSITAGVYSAPITRQGTWVNTRNAVSSDDTLLTTTVDPNCRKWSVKPASAKPVPEWANSVAFRFRFSTAAATAKAYVYAYCEGDDAEFYGSFNLTAGEQIATLGGYYCDTITGISASQFYKTIGLIDAAGDNGMAKIASDGCALKHWVILLDDISAGSVSVDMRWF